MGENGRRGWIEELWEEERGGGIEELEKGGKGSRDRGIVGGREGRRDRGLGRREGEDGDRNWEGEGGERRVSIYEVMCRVSRGRMRRMNGC